MMIKWTAIILILALNAHAEEVQTSTTTDQGYVTEHDFDPYVGILAGAATTKDADESSGEFGVEAGYQLRPIALAAEFSGSKYEEFNEKKDKTNLLLKGQYYFSSDSVLTKYTFLGLGLGIIVRANDTDFTAGPLAGFDVPVSGQPNGKHFSLGAAAKYLFTNATPTEGVALNGSLKYWF